MRPRLIVTLVVVISLTAGTVYGARLFTANDNGTTGDSPALSTAVDNSVDSTTTTTETPDLPRFTTTTTLGLPIPTRQCAGYHYQIIHSGECFQNSGGDIWNCGRDSLPRMRVIGQDPSRLDGDNNGIACELKERNN